MNVTVSYRNLYTYEEAVSFSQHTVRLFPRQDSSLQVRKFQFRTNETADVQFRRDVFDNAIINVFYPDASATLLLSIEMELMVKPLNPFHFLLDPSALQFPFQYSESKKRLLTPYIGRPVKRGMPSLPFWEAPTKDSPAPTLETLIGLNTAISENIEYERREHGHALDPQETVAEGKGACRDVAVLFASVVRSHGLACRLASGYLCEFDVDEAERKAEASLHAWVEVYLPGAGWVGFDPTSGVLCDHNFISAAIGASPDDISPVSGHYFADKPVNSVMDASVTLGHPAEES